MGTGGIVNTKKFVDRYVKNFTFSSIILAFCGLLPVHAADRYIVASPNDDLT